MINIKATSMFTVANSSLLLAAPQSANWEKTSNVWRSWKQEKYVLFVSQMI